MSQGYHVALLGIESLATEALLDLLAEGEISGGGHLSAGWRRE